MSAYPTIHGSGAKSRPAAQGLLRIIERPEKYDGRTCNDRIHIGDHELAIATNNSIGVTQHRIGSIIIKNRY